MLGRTEFSSADPLAPNGGQRQKGVTGSVKRPGLHLRTLIITMDSLVSKTQAQGPHTSQQVPHGAPHRRDPPRRRRRRLELRIRERLGKAAALHAHLCQDWQCGLALAAPAGPAWGPALLGSAHTLPVTSWPWRCLGLAAHLPVSLPSLPDLDWPALSPGLWASSLCFSGLSPRPCPHPPRTSRALCACGSGTSSPRGGWQRWGTGR